MAHPDFFHLKPGQVSFKAEYMNPSGSFKDRIASVALSIVRERQLAGCLGTSSGNGGAAAASYGARGDQQVVLLTLPEAPSEKLRQILVHGGKVIAVNGLGTSAEATDQVVDAVREFAVRYNFLPYLTGVRYSPEAMEGAKTIAFELLEELPEATVVYVPIGGGGLLTSIHNGYREAVEALGGNLPRLVGVQPEGSATLAPALRGEPGRFAGDVRTSVSGLQVPVLFDPIGAPEAIRETGGHVVQVTDQEVWAAQRFLAEREGIFVEPAGATAFAGLAADSTAGAFFEEDVVVAVLTGSGFKDLSAIDRIVDSRLPESITLEEVPNTLERIAVRRASG